MARKPTFLQQLWNEVQDFFGVSDAERRETNRRAKRVKATGETFDKSKWRKATPEELDFLGYSIRSERYVRVGTKRNKLGKRTPSISKRQYQQSQLGGLSLERRRTLNKAGKYKSGTKQAEVGRTLGERKNDILKRDKNLSKKNKKTSKENSKSLKKRIHKYLKRNQAKVEDFYPKIEQPDEG